MLVATNILTLTILGYVDYKIYKIPNVIIVAWLTTILVIRLICSTPITKVSIISALVTAGIYFPLRQMVKCEAGDFKLYAVLMLASEPINALMICFLSMIFSLIPLAGGVKKVPISLVTLFGYTTFLLIMKGEI